MNSLPIQCMLSLWTVLERSLKPIPGPYFATVNLSGRVTIPLVVLWLRQSHRLPMDMLVISSWLLLRCCWWWWLVISNVMVHETCTWDNELLSIVPGLGLVSCACIYIHVYSSHIIHTFFLLVLWVTIPVRIHERYLYTSKPLVHRIISLFIILLIITVSTVLISTTRTLRILLYFR